MNGVVPDSPVEKLLKTLPRGNGEWAGYSYVYCNLSQAAEKLGRSSRRLGDMHVNTMAIMGTGHEETMKYQQMLLREYGWID